MSSFFSDLLRPFKRLSLTNSRNVSVEDPLYQELYNKYPLAHELFSNHLLVWTTLHKERVLWVISGLELEKSQIKTIETVVATALLDMININLKKACTLNQKDIKCLLQSIKTDDPQIEKLIDNETLHNIVCEKLSNNLSKIVKQRDDIRKIAIPQLQQLKEKLTTAEEIHQSLTQTQVKDSEVPQTQYDESDLKDVLQTTDYLFEKVYPCRFFNKIELLDIKNRIKQCRSYLEEKQCKRLSTIYKQFQEIKNQTTSSENNQTKLKELLLQAQYAMGNTTDTRKFRSRSLNEWRGLEEFCRTLTTHNK